MARSIALAVRGERDGELFGGLACHAQRAVTAFD
jgi:hypothetical protein